MEDRDVLRRTLLGGCHDERARTDTPDLRNHLEPLLRGGVLKMTHPEQPNHPDQAYVLTEDGVKLKTRRMNGETGEESGN